MSGVHHVLGRRKKYFADERFLCLLCIYHHVAQADTFPFRQALLRLLVELYKYEYDPEEMEAYLTGPLVDPNIFMLP